MQDSSASQCVPESQLDTGVADALFAADASENRSGAGVVFMIAPKSWAPKHL